MNTRRKRGLGGSSPVFCTLAGAQIDQSYIRHLLPRIAVRAKLENCSSRTYGPGRSSTVRVRSGFFFDRARKTAFPQRG